MIEVRHAGPSDAAIIALIAREVHAMHATALPDVFRPASDVVVTPADIAGISTQPGHVMLVALHDGHVRGYAHGEVQNVPAGQYKLASAMLHVHAMGVRAAWRGRGVGHALIQAMRREASQRGLSGISLEVYGFNEAASDFYEREGFVVERQRMVWTPRAHRPIMDRAMGARSHAASGSGMLDGYSFTERVRAVLARAHQEASRLRHEYVGTEHLLLSLIRENDGVAAAVFEKLDVDKAGIVVMVEQTVKPGSAPVPNEQLPYTSRAKKVLELAMSEARELNHSYVGTEHLLLGLLREERGIAAQILGGAGMRIDAVRSEVLRQLSVHAPPRRPDTPSSTSAEPQRSAQTQGWNFTDRFRTVLALARNEAALLNHEYVAPQHLLLALVREGGGVAVAAMRSLNIDTAAVRAMIEGLVKRGRTPVAEGAALPYTSRSKRSLELAMEEARLCNHSYVSTEHLLLGLLREEKSIAAQVLHELGLTHADARREILRLLGNEGT